MIKAAKAAKNRKSAGRQNKTPQGGRTKFEKQEQGNVTSDWDQPESGTRRQEEAEEKYSHAAQ